MEELKQIKAVYESYDGLIQKIGSKIVENRFEKLYCAMQKFIEHMDMSKKVFKVNRRLLLISLLDYFADIDRLKQFHHIDDINEYKTKAYESSWILRRHPIQMVEETTSEKNINIENLDYINEQFVFNYLISFLMEGRDVDTTESIKDLNGFFDSLFYYLKFRNCEPRVLELMLISFKAGELVQNIAKKEN